MIALNNLTLTLGGRSILNGVDLNIREGECLAVVGPNGCGKSTLLKVMAGIETPDGGSVSIPKKMSVSYLPQEANLSESHSLKEELLDAFSHVQEALKEMSALEEAMGNTDPDSKEYEKILQRYADHSHWVDHQDGYSMETQVKKVASGLGFCEDDLDRSCLEFSGGWQMRILLAKLLLQNPDVLLLDEPTNHLDLESTLWLEDWIKNCGKTVILVSHERATMDRLANRICCMEWGKAEIYHGDYSNYLKVTKQKRKDQWEAYQRQQKEITSMELFIRRFRATASRATLVQSRIKQLEKIERIEPPFHPTAIHFSFPEAPPSYREVVTLENLGHSYGDLNVFSNLDLSLFRGEKIGLVGVNGAGKSTLLRILSGQEKATEGEFRLGGKVQKAYFAQYESETLSSNTTLVESLEAVAPTGASSKARDVLGAFLFRGDDVTKPLRALSGGERTRFRLARILFSPANLLLLDEPTNHLDVTSRATVEEALKDFKGTVIVVSHDRVFMNRVTNKIIEIENGELNVYPGKYNDYLEFKEKLLSEETGRERRDQKGGNNKKQPTSKEERIKERAKKKAQDRLIRNLKRKISEIEKEIESLDSRLVEVDEAMAKPEVSSDFSKLSPLSEERQKITLTHSRKIKEWESLLEELGG